VRGYGFLMLAPDPIERRSAVGAFTWRRRLRDAGFATPETRHHVVDESRLPFMTCQPVWRRKYSTCSATAAPGTVSLVGWRPRLSTPPCQPVSIRSPTATVRVS